MTSSRKEKSGDGGQLQRGAAPWSADLIHAADRGPHGLPAANTMQPSWGQLVRALGQASWLGKRANVSGSSSHMTSPCAHHTPGPVLRARRDYSCPRCTEPRGETSPGSHSSSGVHLGLRGRSDASARTQSSSWPEVTTSGLRDPRAMPSGSNEAAHVELSGVVSSGCCSDQSAPSAAPRRLRLVSSVL